MIVWLYLVSLIKAMCIFRCTAGRVSLQTESCAAVFCVYFISSLQAFCSAPPWGGSELASPETLSCRPMQTSAQASKASSTLKCERLLCLLAVNLLVSVNHSKPGSIPCCHLKIRSKQYITWWRWQSRATRLQSQRSWQGTGLGRPLHGVLVRPDKWCLRGVMFHIAVVWILSRFMW